MWTSKICNFRFFHNRHRVVVKLNIWVNIWQNIFFRREFIICSILYLNSRQPLINICDTQVDSNPCCRGGGLLQTFLLVLQTFCPTQAQFHVKAAFPLAKWLIITVIWRCHKMQAPLFSRHRVSIHKTNEIKTMQDAIKSTITNRWVSVRKTWLRC